MKAGNKSKAIEAEQKAIESAKAKAGYAQLKKLEANLEKYKGYSL
jgi:hypothetical protein